MPTLNWLANSHGHYPQVISEYIGKVMLLGKQKFGRITVFEHYITNSLTGNGHNKENQLFFHNYLGKCNIYKGL